MNQVLAYSLVLTAVAGTISLFYAGYLHHFKDHNWRLVMILSFLAFSVAGALSYVRQAQTAKEGLQAFEELEAIVDQLPPKNGR